MATLYKRIALGDESDLLIPTSTPQYKLGEIVQIVDKNNANPEVLGEFLYIKHILNIDVQEPIIITFSITKDAEVVASLPLAEVQPIELVGISQVKIEPNFYGFTQIKGNALTAVFAQGGAINIGDPLHLSQTINTELVPSGSPDQTVALALAFLGTGSVIDFPILMLGNKVAIAS